VIISHRHRFIFLKTRKTAGTSVEIALSRFCGPDDVITEISEEDEALRREQGFRGPQNTEIPTQRLDAPERLRARLWGGPPRFVNHAPAASVRRHVDPEVWSSYFKFCFERNPYDKAISRYYWSTRETSAPRPIADFLAHARRRQISNWRIYTIRNRIAVDFVGRFEHLREDLAAALSKLGLPTDVELPRAKTRFRSDKRHYSEVLDARSRALVERVCARELAAFGYAWNGAAPR
jgi:hypothetical protein